MKHIFIFFVSVLLICLLPLSASAFSYIELSENEISNIRENINVELLDSFSETDKQAFSCFDISQNEKIVLKIDNGQTKDVIVLDEKGDFLYGFTLKTYGDIGVGWENDNVVIYFVRSDIAVVLNEQANVLSIKKIDNTVENDTYWNKSVYAKKRVCGDSTYVMKSMNPVLNLLDSRAILQKVDANGNAIVLYDASQSFYQGIVVGAIVFVVVFGVFAAIFIPSVKSSVKNREKTLVS